MRLLPGRHLLLVTGEEVMPKHPPSHQSYATRPLPLKRPSTRRWRRRRRRCGCRRGGRRGRGGGGGSGGPGVLPCVDRAGGRSGRSGGARGGPLGLLPVRGGPVRGPGRRAEELPHLLLRAHGPAGPGRRGRGGPVRPGRGGGERRGAASAGPPLPAGHSADLVRHLRIPVPVGGEPAGLPEGSLAVRAGLRRVLRLRAGAGAQGGGGGVPKQAGPVRVAEPVGRPGRSPVLLRRAGAGRRLRRGGGGERRAGGRALVLVLRRGSSRWSNQHELLSPRDVCRHDPRNPF
mmetsp:Transcript_26235/g.42838  ORF Transcript_26235/g.42838 Transcript_26235/m.42838 type:complete len:289 (+) Transcript_26235:1962-2828(+)